MIVPLLAVLTVPGSPAVQASTAPVAVVSTPPNADLTVRPADVPIAEAGVEEPEETVVVGRRPKRNDPLRAANAVSFELTQKVDDVVIAPVAHAYERATPRPVRTGIRNFLRNLREPIAFANFLLQLKVGKAAETVGRFAINSTIGVLGVVDVAKRCPFNLPYRPNGFSDTLGVYGVKEGPYLFLPLIGPTTVRDIAGGAVDGIASPLAIGGPFRNRGYIVASNAFRVLNQRVEMDGALQAVRESADPYAARRDLYLQGRADRIARLNGKEAVNTPDPEDGAIVGEAAPVDAASSCGRREQVQQGE
ncbi:VacJ family lipoprotein [Sphingomonas sp. Leaf10]|uniref:MlaA family lipoprotein n=1 Tax=Sphingomonas sp. Leaf10 TaxID=1735676 RepID=UPI0007012C97|nr:VacJ family lipoprotein [Sphingomonas sp. Leaf10]KQM35880.1 hypothetical protein ASE59_17800 [Sphingomonas sp. Leaf10]